MSAAQGIKETNQKFMTSFNEGNAAGVGSCYSEDGCFMVPNADTFQGREAITNAIQGLIDAGISKIELNTQEIEDLGNTAIEHGEFALYAGENVADKGRFMVHWINVDGDWLLYRDIINSVLPAS